ncbi:MAG: hypothetical protein R3D45_01350 [Rhizobiaceae bacterium]
MNPLHNRAGRAAVRVFNRYREYRRQTIAARLMEDLPAHTKRDVGWPPFGDLDRRARY